MSLKLTAKNWIIECLSQDIDAGRKQIRHHKKVIKYIEQMKSAMRNKTEDEILDIIAQEEDLLRGFVDLVKKAEEHNAEISQNIKDRLGIFEAKLTKKQAEAMNKIGIKAEASEEPKEATPEGVCT